MKTDKSLLNTVMARIFAPLLLSVLPFALYGRDIRTVEGTSVYVVPRTVSLEEAENIAIQRAITNALASEFGTVVQSEVWTEIFNADEGSGSDVWANGLNMVKGEWLETIGKPIVNLRTSNEGYVVEASVKGKAVAIESAAIDIKAQIKQRDSSGIRDGNKFRSGNRLLVDFASPVNGYLSVYLADADTNVVRLLPFASDTAPAVFVKGGERYTFFSDNSGEIEEEYTLFTNDERERNIIYILFSPRDFSGPFSALSGEVRMLSAQDFRKWLTKQRASDSKLQTLVRPILIQR